MKTIIPKLSILIMLLFVGIFITNAQNFIFQKGAKTTYKAGVYYNKKIPTPMDEPGGRFGAMCWTGKNGDLWLYGGYGSDSKGAVGFMNDLWRFDVDSNAWVWMHGSKEKGEFYNSGVKGKSSNSNTPGGRQDGITWTDNDGNLWLFGGKIIYQYGQSSINDLWKFDIQLEQWIWMHGSSVPGAYGIYGKKGVEDTANTPGCREKAIGWTDNNNDFWLYGGLGNAKSIGGQLSDLWKFSVKTNSWTWISGSDSIYDMPIFGKKGIKTPNAHPGLRYSSLSWADSKGNLWLFGGQVFLGKGPTNDLWKYEISTNTWLWMSGDTLGNQHGIYGTMGVEATTNIPGTRKDATCWTDKNGYLWLYGGKGYPESNGKITSYLSDLWRYNPRTNLWTWIDGSKDADQNISINPGARDQALGWLGKDGSLYLFGGYGMPNKGSVKGGLSDLWKYPLCSVPVKVESYSKDVALCSGSSHIIKVSVTGDYPIDFQWYKNNQIIIGANDSLLEFPSTDPNLSGIYSCVCTNGCGTDSTGNIMLKINESYELKVYESISDKDSFYFGGTYFKKAGVYNNSFKTINGCDSFVELDLRVNEYFTSVSTTTCSNDSFAFGGKILTKSGVYYDTITSSNNWDSIIELNITLNKAYEIPISETICNGDSLHINGQYLSSPGSYYFKLKTVTQCDSFIDLNLTMLPTYKGTHDTSICDGESIFLGGADQTKAGTYVDHYRGINGCDSSITTVLTIRPKPNKPMITVESNGDYSCNIDADAYNWFFNGQPTSFTTKTITPDQEGNYRVSIIVDGCESDRSNLQAHTNSIFEYSTLIVNVYPNPNHGNFVIEIEGFLPEESTLYLHDQLGRKIIEEKITTSKINLNNLNKGIYYLVIMNKKGVLTKKVNVI